MSGLLLIMPWLVAALGVLGVVVLLRLKPPCSSCGDDDAACPPRR